MTGSKINYSEEFLNICAIVIKCAMGALALVFTILIFGRMLRFGMILDAAVLSSQKAFLSVCLAYSFKVLFVISIPFFLILWSLIIMYVLRNALKCVKALIA